jgi:nicotinate-nucleotide pyrophosphorylase
MTHEFELDQLASAVKEANIQYYLDDLKIYHSGGITKEDVETVAQDAAQAVEAGLIIGKVK